MALRVLLADESTTIKKVMQLALQDFAVEVKTVHAGVDVVEVARTFKPDVIFADVLLQKRNGYEVCSDLKKDATLKTIPVVLMWSSFMELDEKLAKESGSDRRLEKPFDVEHLRQLILELVPRTRTQRLAHFLKYPPSMSESLKGEERDKREKEQARPAVPLAEPPPAQKAQQPAEPKPQPEKHKPEAQPENRRPEAQPEKHKPEAQPEKQKPEPRQPPAQAAPKSPPIITPPPPPKQAEPPPARSAPAKTPPPLPDAGRPSWDMESFDDINAFAETADSTDDDDPTGFKITPPASVDGRPPSQSLRARIESEKAALASEPKRSVPANEDNEPWSHQDLSRFKLDLPPVSVESEEMELEADENELKPRRQQQRRQEAFEEETLELELTEEPQDDVLGLEIDVPDEPPSMPELTDFEDDERPIHTGTTRRIPRDEELLDLEGGQIPQLTPDRLEEIIRSQSREIIESVVRRIVPDIAADLIREELQRLLEDTATGAARRETTTRDLSKRDTRR